MTFDSTWLNQVIGHLKKDCEHQDGSPIVPIDADPSVVAKKINKYVDEESLANLHSKGVDPLSAAQSVCSIT